EPRRERLGEGEVAGEDQPAQADETEHRRREEQADRRAERGDLLLRLRLGECDLALDQSFDLIRNIGDDLTDARFLLGLHVSSSSTRPAYRSRAASAAKATAASSHGSDRKSTRLNSSHVSISYAVFCLKK